MTALLASLALTLQWSDPHRLFEHGWRGIENELIRTFGPLQVAVRLTKEAPLEKEVDRIRVVLVRSEPAEWGLPPNTLGAVLSQSGPQTQIYVFFPTVVRTIGYRPEALRTRWPTMREGRALSRALARIIAHEVMHAILPSRPHTEDGVTQRSLDRSSLLASRIEIDAESAVELRSALLRQPTVRR